MIKKILDKEHVLISTKHYPWRATRDKNRAKRHKAIVGIGGNIGDVVRRFEHLFWFLMRSPHVTLLQTSPILRNPPFGYRRQADFYNGLIVISTTLTPRELLLYLLQVEKRFGRRRLFKDAPRTLDLDIIFYDDLEMSSDRLTIPHPHWWERNSILIPLKYLKGRR